MSEWIMNSTVDNCKYSIGLGSCKFFDLQTEMEIDLVGKNLFVKKLKKDETDCKKDTFPST